MMSGNNDRFGLSNEYKDIHHYKCFFNMSKKEYISGDELIKNKDSWSFNQFKRWYFFYRIEGFDFGDGQKEEVNTVENEIYYCRIKISELYVKCFVAMAVALVAGYVSGFYAFLVTGILMLYLIIYFSSDVYGIKQKINEFYGKITVLNTEVAFLEKQKNEINALAESISRKEIMKWIYGDIKILEELSFDELLHNKKESILEGIPDFYKNIKKDSKGLPLPNFPFIAVPGIYQLTQESMVGGVSINNFENDMLKTIASDWGMPKDDGKEFFRLWYVQFLFFEEKSLEVVYFYYDFVARKRFNVGVDTFHYNHITNYSFVDSTINYSDNDMLRKVPILGVTNNEQNIKLLSFCSAGGANFRCMLPSEKTFDTISEYLNKKDDIKIDEIGSLSSEEKKKIFNNIFEYEKIFSNIATESFNTLRDRVESFAIKEVDSRVSN